MSFNYEPEWCPIDISDKFKVCLRCPQCGEAFEEDFKRELQGVLTLNYYRAAHIPPILSISNEVCDCDINDFKVKLKVIIEPLE